MSRIPIWAIFGIPTIIIIVIGTIFLTRTPTTEPQDETLPEPVSIQLEGVEEFPIASRQHIANGQAPTDYNSNPPTSGQHWPVPAKNGIYDKSIPDQQIVHSLEHGYVWISYKENTSEEIINELKSIVDEDDWKIILGPRDQNENQVVLAAWGRLLRMDEPDYEKIKEFIRAYRNRGPEKTPD